MVFILSTFCRAPLDTLRYNRICFVEIDFLHMFLFIKEYISVVTKSSHYAIYKFNT
jgi:hypothetical protein